MNDWVAIALLVILLAGNAFFVAGEFAIMSTRRAQIEPLAEEGNKRAQTVIYALENVSLMLATCQLGITICSLLILNVSEPALHHMLEVPLHLVGLPHAIVDVIAFGITLILVTYLHVIFGEMVPKNAAVTLAARGVALWIVPPLVTISKIFAPVVALLNNLSNKLLALMKVEAKDEVASTFTLGELQGDHGGENLGDGHQGRSEGRSRLHLHPGRAADHRGNLNRGRHRGRRRRRD